MIEEIRKSIQIEIENAPPIAIQAAEIIRGKILQGVFSPGERLNEVDLSESLQISRSPIREAFQRLSQEGLVVLVPRKGAFVSMPNAKDIENLFEVREVIEPLAVALAAKKATDLQINQIEELLNNTERTVEKNEYRQYPWDLDYHKQLASCSNNRVLEDMVYQINMGLQIARSRSSAEYGRARGALDEHRAILEAVKMRNAKLARKAMNLHIASAKKNIHRIIER
jgi:DNA-binding GntR family transcriptional regulator